MASGGGGARGVLRHGRRGAGGPEAGRDAGRARGAARRGLRHRPQARRLGRLHRVLPGERTSPPSHAGVAPPLRASPPHAHSCGWGSPAAWMPPSPLLPPCLLSGPSIQALERPPCPLSPPRGFRRIMPPELLRQRLTWSLGGVGGVGGPHGPRGRQKGLQGGRVRVAHRGPCWALPCIRNV